MQFRPHRYRTEFPTVFSTPMGNVNAVINDVNETGALVSISQPLQRGSQNPREFSQQSHRRNRAMVVAWQMRHLFPPPTDHRASRYAAV